MAAFENDKVHRPWAAGERELHGRDLGQASEAPAHIAASLLWAQNSLCRLRSPGTIRASMTMGGDPSSTRGCCRHKEGELTVPCENTTPHTSPPVSQHRAGGTALEASAQRPRRATETEPWRVWLVWAPATGARFLENENTVPHSLHVTFSFTQSCNWTFPLHSSGLH